ncbi:MAG: helix-turn-helix domain-containing protein [Pseudonocardiaceae bacterium]
MLTETDREEISRGIAEGLEGKVIATRIGRCASVVSREIARHGGRAGYRAVVARRVAAEQRSRPKPRRLDVCPELRTEVVTRLRAGHSPDQVPAGCAMRTPTRRLAGCPTRRSTPGSTPCPKASWPATESCCVPGARNADR